MRWLMSDVALSRAPWWKLGLFLAFQGIAWTLDQIPVLIRRGEYRRLQENDYLIESAHQALHENSRLRKQLGDLQ
jgi:hypothetical protein